jgi:Lectin C-type domain
MGGLRHVGARGVYRGHVEGRARRIASVLMMGAFSCLPSENLSSYSNGKPPLEASEALPNDSLTAAPPAAPLGSVEATLPPEQAPGAAPVADCGSECGAPVLSIEPGQENGGPESEGLQNRGDAGVPAATADAQALASDAGASRCLPGSIVGPEQRCFELVSVENSWANARTRCQSNGPGWELTTIHGETRNAWLSSLLGSVTDAWVGASDTETEGSWHWLGDATAFWDGPGGMGSALGNAYENWTGGAAPEPNGGDASDCLRLLAGGSWADFRCAAAFPSICEGPQL